jgi:hypothetical protein
MFKRILPVYLKIIGLILFLGVVFGFVAPGLASAKDDVLVGFALAILVSTLPIVYFFVASILKSIKNLTHSEN